MELGNAIACDETTVDYLSRYPKKHGLETGLRFNYITDG